MIEFFVAGVPKAMSVGKAVHAGRLKFQTRVNNEWATLLGYAGRQHAPPAPLEGGLSLALLFLVPRPDSAAKKIVLPLKRPDIDNLFHKLTDQWNGVFWKDDSQVVDLHAFKRFPRAGQMGVIVRIEPIDMESEIWPER